MQDVLMSKQKIIKKLETEIIDTVNIALVSTRKSNNIINVILIKDHNYELFEEYCLSFSDESNTMYESTNKHTFVTLDFEFNQNKKHALMQLYFDNKINHYIFLVNPYQVTSTFTKNILENHHVIKLLHGSESLDIPFINQTFCNSKDSFTKFINSTYDTRFACEYVKTYTNHINKEPLDIKCSLYTALLHYKVINKKQYDQLIELCNSMIHMSIINWDINKLRPEQIKYAYMDTVYLRHLYKNIIDVAKKHDQVYQGLKVIPSFFRLLCLTRQGYDTTINDIKNIYDPLNSYIIKDSNKTLFDYYNDTIINITLSNKLEPQSFLFVQTFRKMCTTFFKSVIYNYVLSKHDVYLDKNTKNTKKYNNVTTRYKRINILLKSMRLFFQ